MDINIDIDIADLLMPDVLTMVTQLCATALMFFLIYKFAYKPVKRILNERSAYEQTRLKEADELKEEAQRLNAEANAQISQANDEAQEIVSRAQGEGVRIKDNLVEEGQKKAQQLVDDAQANIALQKSKMLDDMHEEIVDIAMSAAEKMLQKKLDEETDKDSIENFIKEVTNK